MEQDPEGSTVGYRTRGSGPVSKVPEWVARWPGRSLVPGEGAVPEGDGHREWRAPAYPADRLTGAADRQQCPLRPRRNLGGSAKPLQIPLAVRGEAAVPAVRQDPTIVTPITFASVAFPEI